MSFCLTQRGIDHLVLERDRVAQDWRESRWDSSCLVTPNWQCRLPGFSYTGDDPGGFMTRDEVVASERGVTDVAGLYVVGLPWLHTWSSGHVAGIGRDAAYLAELIEIGDRMASVTELPRPAFGR